MVIVSGSEYDGGFRRPDVILIIDLGAGSMSVFPLGKFISVFFYGMLYFNENLLKQQKNEDLNITSIN